MMRWTLEAMGFNTQIMPLPEVYLAIQQGAVAGQENPIDTIYSNKFYEVAPNVTLTRHVYSPIPLAVSEKTWQKFSPADQRAVKEAAQVAATFSRQLGLEQRCDQIQECIARERRSMPSRMSRPFARRCSRSRCQGPQKVRRDVDAALLTQRRFARRRSRRAPPFCRRRPRRPAGSCSWGVSWTVGDRDRRRAGDDGGEQRRPPRLRTATSPGSPNSASC